MYISPEYMHVWPEYMHVWLECMHLCLQIYDHLYSCILSKMYVYIYMYIYIYAVGDLNLPCTSHWRYKKPQSACVTIMWSPPKATKGYYREVSQ